jgi:hypothetical protein
MIYTLLADMVIMLHLAFIAFVIFGGLLAIRNVKWAWLHVPAVIWAGLIELMGWICPLTPLENWLWFRAGARTYQDSFTAHYIIPIIYPTGLTRSLQIILGAAVVLLNLVIYSLVLYKRRRRS